MGGTDPGTGRVTSSRATLKRKQTMPFITITYPPKYPLTESEKVWLEERKQYIQQYSSETFCKYCYYVKEVPKGWACVDCHLISPAMMADDQAIYAWNHLRRIEREEGEE